MSFLSKAFNWVRHNEPAIATGVVASGALAVLERVATGEITWTAAVPLVATALVRQFVFSPSSAVVVRSKGEIRPGPGCER